MYIVQMTDVERKTIWEATEERGKLYRDDYKWAHSQYLVFWLYSPDTHLMDMLAGKMTID
jgi:hypothetical protein